MDAAIAIVIVVLGAAVVGWQLYRDARGKGGCGGGCGGCRGEQDSCPSDEPKRK